MTDKVLDGIFDHKHWCKAPDYQECTCDVKKAAERVMKEIILFTDRPDYVIPVMCHNAMVTLSAYFGIERRSLLRTGDLDDE